MNKVALLFTDDPKLISSLAAQQAANNLADLCVSDDLEPEGITRSMLNNAFASCAEDRQLGYFDVSQRDLSIELGDNVDFTGPLSIVLRHSAEKSGPVFTFMDEKSHIVHEISATYDELQEEASAIFKNIKLGSRFVDNGYLGALASRNIHFSGAPADLQDLSTWISNALFWPTIDDLDPTIMLPRPNVEFLALKKN